MTAKLIITPLDTDLQPSPLLGPFEVPFNPTSYSISKSVTWRSPYPSVGFYTDEFSSTDQKLNAPILVFGGGGSRILNLELFFDVTESAGLGASLPGQISSLTNATSFLSTLGRAAIQPGLAPDVRTQTNKLVQLTRIKRGLGQEEPPPVCRFSWGTVTPPNSDFPFTGVITDLRQNFTLFSPDGRPLRAVVNMQIREYLDVEKDQIETDPEASTYVVKRSDTISGIAARIYNDPARWRTIAEANRLDDPRELTAGQTLLIPKA